MPRTKGKGQVAVGGCTDRDCPNNKHFFRPPKKNGVTAPLGPCLGCGESPVDFDRVHKRDAADLPHTIKAMRLEKVRDDFWQREFNDAARRYAEKRGAEALCAAAGQKVQSILGKPADAYDGRRVPHKEEKMENPYQYAFHATATCCRRCTEYWHGIPRDRPLSGDESKYLTNLVTHYLRKRMPSLLQSEAAEEVPVLTL